MIRSQTSRRLAFTTSLLLSTAISPAAFAQSITILDGSSYANSGHVDNVEGEGDVGTFENTATGEIADPAGYAASIVGNVASFINAGTISGDDGAVLIGGGVTTFSNTATGTIIAVGGSAIDITGPVESFTNAGTVTGGYIGIWFGDEVASFINAASGSITGADDHGVVFEGGVKDFQNAGSILGDLDGVNISGEVTSFTNAAGGTIVGTNASGIYLDGAVGTFSNAGSITGGGAGVIIEGDVGAFANSGSISGGGVGLLVNGATNAFSNSGSIAATEAGVKFEGDVASFRNEAGGVIKSATLEAVGLTGNTGAFVNAGTIDGGEGGIYSYGRIADFNNTASGTISGNTDAGVIAIGGVDRFTNAGRISGRSGIYFGEDVGSFANLASGVITGDENAVLFAENLTSFNNAGVLLGSGAPAVLVYGDVASFVNSGKIASTNSGVHIEGGVDNFSNSGSISGTARDGVRILGQVAAFNNAAGGRIESTDQFGVYLKQGVENFTNAGTISAGSSALFFAKSVGSFFNAASGTIVGGDNALFLPGTVNAFRNAGVMRGLGIAPVVLIAETAKSFENSGLIEGADWGVGLSEVDSFLNTGTIIGGDGGRGIGVSVGFNLDDNPARKFVNTGTIEGANIATLFTGGVNMTNAGVLRGGFAAFISDGVNDDYLTLLTGSQIFGALSFGGGYDTLDFSGFTGNTLLDVYGLETVVPGDRNYVDTRFDDPANGGAAGQIAIFDISGIDNKAVGRELGDVAASVRGIVGGQLAQEYARSQAPVAPLGYAATKPTTGAAAALSGFETAPRSDVSVWSTAVAGGSSDKDTLDLNSRYGGLAVGSHTRVNDNLILGGIAGYFGSTSRVHGGAEKLDSQTGVLGIYGKTAVGVIDLDFAVLGGVSSHTSKREVVAILSIETASGEFTSVFIAPSLGVSLPVLSKDATTVSLRGEASYVAGLTTGYTETGSSMNLTVAGQSIGFLDVRVGVEVHHELGRNAALVAKAGVLGQANLGSSNVSVTTLGHSVDAGSPGTSSFGIYGGVGFDAALSDNFTLKVSLDGVARADGRNSLSANIGIGGKF